MTSKITLKKLAAHLELSVTTVSRALKEGPEVRPETISRVKQAASELGYFPDQRGFNLSTGKTNTIFPHSFSRSPECFSCNGIHELLPGHHP